jgi:ABC-type sugar transport system ATPase subunit
MTRGRLSVVEGRRKSVSTGVAGGSPEKSAGAAVQTAEPALKLSGFGVPGRVGPVDLEIGPGEIVGLAGLVGSGRTTLARAIVGAVKGAVGSITTPLWSGRPKHPAEAAGAGILLLTEDRKREGIVCVRSVGENIAITSLGRGLSRFGFVRGRARKAIVRQMIDRLGIVPKNPAAVASSLSGGNQQKLVLARAIATGAGVLILDQPTAGVDIGAKADLYRQLDCLSREGVAFLLISDDLDELLNLCDRIAVVSRGRIGTLAPAASYDRARLLQAITTYRAPARP